MQAAASSPPSESRVVLITGAAQRLGRSMASALAEAGYAVAVHHNTTPPDQTLSDLKAMGATAAAFAADLREVSLESAAWQGDAWVIKVFVMPRTYSLGW